jgi:hypothetical protein
MHKNMDVCVSFLHLLSSSFEERDMAILFLALVCVLKTPVRIHPKISLAEKDSVTIAQYQVPVAVVVLLLLLLLLHCQGEKVVVGHVFVTPILCCSDQSDRL